MIQKLEDGSLEFSVNDKAPVQERIREAMLDSLRMSWMIFAPTGKKAKQYKRRAEQINKMKHKQLMKQKHVLIPYDRGHL